MPTPSRAAIDAVIFDMDGVLLDISGSIRVVNCLSVPYYLRTVLGWPAPDDLLTSADIEMFKNAGGFNDDWDLTYALVLHYIAKGHEHPSAAPETLNVIQPNLARYAARIKERGGWLRAAEEIAFEHLTRDDRLAVETDYRKYLIKQIFQEMFAGEYCERLYGYAPTLYTGPGYINNDRPLLDLAKLPERQNAGRPNRAHTGRGPHRPGVLRPGRTHPRNADGHEKRRLPKAAARRAGKAGRAHGLFQRRLPRRRFRRPADGQEL